MTSLTKFDAVRVTGADAATFLNGQFTSDVTTLRADAALPGAFLTPKGRALAVALLRRDDAGLLLWTTSTRLEALIAHLSRYVLRAKVRFEPLDTTPPVSLTLPDASKFSFTEPELDARAARAGVPLLAQNTADAFVPQMINLDLLGGVDFAKGCYTGQEIVARTHHLGTIKRRMLAFACAPSDSIKVGADVRTAAGDSAGRVVVVGNDRVLASVRLATIKHELIVGAQSLGEQLALPYSIPELDDA